MTAWSVLVALFILQTGDAEPVEPTLDADPCPFGTHGPGAESTLDEAPPEYPGFSGETRSLTVSDPCGLRFTDLSGVWRGASVQFIAAHDPRTGVFEMRYMHVPYENELFSQWGFRFGDDVVTGRISTDPADIRIGTHVRYPIGMRDACPEQWARVTRAHSIRLDQDSEGRTRMRLDRMWSWLTQAGCAVEHREFVEDSYTRLREVDLP